MSTSLVWELTQTDHSTTVIFQGIIDEDANFNALHTLKGHVVFDLAGITRINSAGILRWHTFLDTIAANTTLTLTRCSLAVVAQLNLHDYVQGHATIESIYAPYICEATGQTETRLLNIRDIIDPHRPPTFPGDQGLFELDDLPERYFAFLLRPRPPSR